MSDLSTENKIAIIKKFIDFTLLNIKDDKVVTSIYDDCTIHIREYFSGIRACWEDAKKAETPELKDKLTEICKKMETDNKFYSEIIEEILSIDPVLSVEEYNREIHKSLVKILNNIR